MQECWLILILLVGRHILVAHGRKLESNKEFMTSLPGKEYAIRQTDVNGLNLDNIVTIRTPSSAVQDWSLVCQQLCGAALGGAVCAPYCKRLPYTPFTVQLEFAKEIMDSKKDLICPELCGLQLGDDVCTCKDYLLTDFDAHMKAKQQRNVCAIICDHNSVTLAGCTPCNRIKNNQNMLLKNLETLFQEQVVPVKAKKPTTPNWKELCASLCKTGDGGSLCNCDLSPFMI